MTGDVVVIAGYRFVPLPDRDELRMPFLDFCKSIEMRGTILLSHEGINFFLSGSQGSIDQFVEYLEKDERFAGMTLKYSYTDVYTHNRMLVRLKKEIISLGMDEIVPVEYTGPSISPQEFKAWLDEGKEVAILDTRNDYELKIGTFKNAIDLDIKSFRAFPAAVEANSEKFKGKPVVMFCTGGIRCEKASVMMLNAGYEDIYQLDGGILNYFEQVGGDHWDGDCFVFDNRVALDPKLEQTNAAICYACWEPLTEAEQELESYVIGQSCMYCINGKPLAA